MEVLDELDELKLELADLESDEPECDCVQTGVDHFSAHGCEYCDPQSQWNCDRRRIREKISLLQFRLSRMEVPALIEKARILLEAERERS